MSNDQSVIEGTAIDPVCGISVAMHGAQHIAKHEGATHSFCSSRCLDKFRKDPDGITDAPALAASHVGIAMGTTTDVAIKSASVTLVRGDLVGVVQALVLSRASLWNIRQNLFFAFAYNALGIPVAARVLYPWTGLLLNPMIAAAAMSLSSVSVIGNAQRLRGLALPKFET